MAEARLRVSEIFHSLQGESSRVGLPTVFIRLTGCPLRCGYCDTTYAFKGGEWMSVGQILDRVKGFATRYVTVTGGEPLAQTECPALLEALCDAGYEVSLETSGALDITTVDSRVMRVMDLKTPGSGEKPRNRLENIEHLTAGDELKFVVCDRKDYEWTRLMIERYQLQRRCPVLVSPAFGEMDPAELAQWILDDRLEVRFQLQMHKVLWGEERAR